MAFKRVRDKLSGLFGGGGENPEYIEIDLGQEIKKSKILVRPFLLKSFDDVNAILNSLREGYTIAVVDIKPLKTKDIIELRTLISKENYESIKNDFLIGLMRDEVVSYAYKTGKIKVPEIISNILVAKEDLQECIFQNSVGIDLSKEFTIPLNVRVILNPIISNMITKRFAKKGPIPIKYGEPEIFVEEENE